MAEEQQGNEAAPAPQQPQQKQDEAGKESAMGWIQGYFARRLKQGWDSGHIQAFGLQGVGELGNVFGRAWPDSTHVDQPGAIFSPLYRDMASPTGPNIYGHRSDERSPSEIAGDNTVHGPDNSKGLHKGKSL